MFTRLKKTIAVLKAREDHGKTPDVVFLDEGAIQQTTMFSRRFVDLLEALVVIYVLVSIGGFLGGVLFPEREVSAKTFSSVVAGLIALFISVSCSVKLHEFISKVVGRVRLANHLYPYFGNRLEKTLRTIRG